MKNIYYVFENVVPTQDELKEQGCESLSEFIKDFSEESELLNDITYVNYYKHGESIENALGNEPTILSKIKYDLNIDTKEDPKVFVEDTSYKHDDYIKITSNRDILKKYLKFIYDLNEEFVKIQQKQLKDDNDKMLPNINQILNSIIGEPYHEFTTKRDMYTNPIFQKCAIAIVDVELGSIVYCDLEEFIDQTINLVGYGDIPTYYIHTKLCSIYNY